MFHKIFSCFGHMTMVLHARNGTRLFTVYKIHIFITVQYNHQIALNLTFKLMIRHVKCFMSVCSTIGK